MTTKLAKHTPGPWAFVAEDGSFDAGVILGENGWSVASVIGDCKSCSEDEPYANARLIAAAPTLLADGAEFLKATEALLDWMNGLDLSADHADNRPADYERLCASLEKFHIAIRAAVGAQEENTRSG